MAWFNMEPIPKSKSNLISDLIIHSIKPTTWIRHYTQKNLKFVTPICNWVRNRATYFHFEMGKILVIVIGFTNTSGPEKVSQKKFLQMKNHFSYENYDRVDQI